MVDVYTDRDSMFTVTPHTGESKQQRVATDRLTQLGCSLRELGIGWIAAYSPQAKGRIERSFLTAQDRLVKQLRLAKVRNLEAANVFLEKEYWPEWNERFARPVVGFPNQHRQLAPELDLAAILCHVEQRVIANDYTFSFNGQRYQIARSHAQAGMRHQPLRVDCGSTESCMLWISQSVGRVRPCRHRRLSPSARITMPAEGVLGCRASLIGPVRRCGKLSVASEEKPFGNAGQNRPGDPRAFYAQSLRSGFHQSNGPTARQYPPGAPETLTGSASQEGIRRLLRSQPRRLGFGPPRQARPRRGCATIA
jgi:hypothetical protein